jgi:hypothetical protein
MFDVAAASPIKAASNQELDKRVGMIWQNLMRKSVNEGRPLSPPPPMFIRIGPTTIQQVEITKINICVIRFVHSHSKVQFGDEFVEGTGATNRAFGPKDSDVKISRK